MGAERHWGMKIDDFALHIIIPSTPAVGDIRVVYLFFLSVNRSGNHVQKSF